MTNTTRILEKLDHYEKLMRLDKPIGTLLLLWPTLWALWFAAEGPPAWMLVWIFALGTLLMRSAGCVINDFADRNFDPHVERTKERPLAARKVSSKEALGLFFLLCLAALALILPLGNMLVIGLACIGAFLAATYPFTKRFLPIPQAYLGIAYGFGIPMAYAAQTHAVPTEAWLLLIAKAFWTVAYDTEYAMVDRNDDLKIGIKTSAITFGRYDVAAIMACYGVSFAMIGAIGHGRGLGWPFYIGLGIAVLLAGYHYTLIRGRERAPCFKAFLHNNWVGAALFVGIASDYALRTNSFLAR